MRPALKSLARFAMVGCLIGASAARAESIVVERATPIQTWPIDVAVQVGSLGFYPQAANPSVTVGTEYSLRQGPIYAFALAPALGSVYLRDNMVGGLVEVAAINRWKSRFGLYAEATIGAGYQLTVFPGTTYVARAGKFVVGGNDPESMLRARLSVGLGFDFESLGWRAVRVSAQYGMFILTPYAPGNGLPVVPGGQFMIGLSVPLSTGGGRQP